MTLAWSPRRQQVADAALSVLAADGARGLTHRAVDRAAGLPEGSTSNYFRTREALLTGALRRHVELDTPPGADAPRTSLSDEQAVVLVLEAVEHILEPSRQPLMVARYELFLESTRRPVLQRELSEARGRFVELAEALLGARGCSASGAHAAQLVALLDGMLIDQLLGAESALGRAEIEDAVRRFFATC